MELDVGDLAGRTGLTVDTIRYYQSFGLIPPPVRRGRRAFYGREHLERIERVRGLAARGFSLKAIRALLEAGEASESDRALLAAIEEQAPVRRYSARDVAKRVGLSDEVLRAVEKAGLAEAEADADGESGYTEADIRVAAGAMKLLEYGFPLTRLIGLAVRYDRAVRKTVDEAIDLFDEHVRKADGSADGQKVANAFRELLPATTALVAHHFQRRLVNRAIRRLKRSGRRRDLRKALEAASAARLKLRW